MLKITTWEELSNTPSDKLLALKKFGKTSLREIMRGLAKRGLSLREEQTLSGDIEETPNIPIRIHRLLRRKGIFTWEGLLNYTEKELLNLRGLGPASVKEISSTLAKAGLSLKQ